MSYKIVFIFLLLPLLFFVGIQAASAITVPIVKDVYIQLDIKEEKIDSGVKFSLNKASVIYGSYENRYKLYDYKEATPSDYTLETYNINKQLISNYEIKSSRLVQIDFQENGGRVIELQNGVIQTIMPYAREMSTVYIRVDNKGVKTNFIYLPVAQLAQSSLKQINFCKQENYGGYYIKDSCCSGLVPVVQQGGSFICVRCGDGICSRYESKYVCPEDCGVKLKLTVLPGALSSLLIEAVSTKSMFFAASGGIIILLIFLAIDLYKKITHTP